MNRSGGQVMIRKAGTDIRRLEAGVATDVIWAETLLDGRSEGDLTVLKATMAPNCRTHWHSHPRGQWLIALDGVGLLGLVDRPAEELRAGDSVWIAPGEPHWHAAAATAVFTYLSMQAVGNGRIADWQAPVGQEEQRP